MEIDAVLGRNFIFALEAKRLTGKQAIFKHKIAFSAQALADITGREAHSLLSIVREENNEIRITVALLSPQAKPQAPERNHAYVINDLKPYAKFNITLPVRRS